MLINAVMEFKQIDKPWKYVEEGCIHVDNDEYTCTSDGDIFYVFFKFSNMFNQLLIIKPDWETNLDPDCGTSFMKANVISFIECLISDKKYL